MRTPTRRLTHWVHRQSGEIRETELYDYSEGFIETKNIASEKPQVVEQLSAELKAAFELDAFQRPEPNALASGDGDETLKEQVALSGTVSPEKAKPGPFTELETGIGTWTSDVGQAIVDNKHAKTSKRCLQLTGGEKTAVTLRIADGVGTSRTLSFWAERWTVRKPFSFRIEKNSGKGWIEIYNGDTKVRVGRAILNHLKIPIADEGIEQLRFTCFSPPEHGHRDRRASHFSAGPHAGRLGDCSVARTSRAGSQRSEPGRRCAGWGREMLRNYRPDHIYNSNYGWRYVSLVSSCVKYGSQDVKYDRPELQNYQNILMNGGVCGRRAFIGRFILRSFGIPTTARPSRGHVALAHWTPEGWVVNLGGGWGSGWTKTRCNKDVDE